MAQRKRPVPRNVVRAHRLARAAQAVTEVEVAYALERTTAGAEAVKRELAEAAFDYLARHWDGYIPAADRGPGVVAIAAALDEYRGKVA